MKAAILVGILALCGVGCSTTHDSHLTGMTIAEAMAAESIEPEDVRFFDEPPGILRAVRMSASRGRSVEFYIKRGAIPFNADRDWSIEDVLDEVVIGVVRESR